MGTDLEVQHMNKWEQVDFRIRGLLEYLSGAMSELADNPELPVLRIIIEGLERLGPGNDPTSEHIRRYALEFKADVFCQLGRLDEAFVAFQTARALSEQSERAHWTNTVAMVRILCRQGKETEGFDLIGRSIQAILDHGPGEVQWSDYFDVIASCPLTFAMSSQPLRASLSQYAEQILHTPGSDMLERFEQNPLEAIEILRRGGTGLKG